MGKISKIIFISILYTFFQNCNAQNVNYLPYDNYVNIKTNGVTLNDINESKGNPTILNTLFNKQFVYKELTDPDIYKNLVNDELNIQFLKASNLGGSDYELDYLEILSSNIILEIKGKTYKLGDQFNNTNSQIIINSISGDIIYQVDLNSNTFFTKSENFFLIELENNIITKIKYVVLD